MCVCVCVHCHLISDQSIVNCVNTGKYHVWIIVSGFPIKEIVQPGMMQPHSWLNSGDVYVKWQVVPHQLTHLHFCDK